MVASAGLMSCGGRAADSLEPEASEPSDSESADNPPAVIIGPRRETCADNPLLAECPRAYDVCRDNPQNAGCAAAPEQDYTAEELIVAAAENILLSHCGGCHGPALTESQASDSINYINDWSRLLQVGLIERCAPERSRIIRLIRAGEMPPPSAALSPVLDVETEMIAAAIDFGCGGE
jgi:hypothetical protein